MIRRLLVVTAILVASCRPALARTFVVDPNGTGDFEEIYYAMLAARNGDVVKVKPGVYWLSMPLDFAGEAYTLRAEDGHGPWDCVITLAGPTPVVRFRSREGRSTVLDGFTITGGRLGGVFCDKRCSPTLRNCWIRNNWTNIFGGGVYCNDEASPLLVNCVISDNFATRGGAVHCEVGASPAFVHCTISGNTADEGGGVTCKALCQVDFKDCILWDNAAESLIPYLFSTVTATHSCIELDSPWHGDGNINANPRFCAWGARGDVFVDSSTEGPGDGSPEHPFSDLTETLGRYSLSLSEDSPCIGTAHDGTNMGSDLVEVDPATCGQAGSTSLTVHVAPGTYTLRDPVFAWNFTHHVDLVGADRETTVLQGTITGLRSESLLRGVSMTAAPFASVLLSTAVNVLIEDCDFYGNVEDSWQWGGAIYCGHGSSATVKNCTMTDNDAKRGGAVFVASGSSMQFLNCTITRNTAESGGAFFLTEQCMCVIKNSIVWDNTEPWMYYGHQAVAVALYSCVPEMELDTSRNNIHSDPRLCEGPGLGIQADSPCIGTAEDGGNMGAALGICHADAKFFHRGDANADGKTTVSDAIFLLRHFFRGGAVPPCKKSGDCDDNGRLEFTDPVLLLNHLFRGGRPLKDPFLECGADTTPDPLSCREYAPCASQ